MNFTINNTVFTDNNFSNNLLSNHLQIKSFNKVYDVIYQNSSLDEILNLTYTKNDFILIDRNIYKLYECDFLINNDNNIYIYDVT